MCKYDIVVMFFATYACYTISRQVRIPMYENRPLSQKQFGLNSSIWVWQVWKYS